MISIDKYGVCVCVATVCVLFIHILTHATITNPPPTHLTGSTEPLGLPIQVLVFCLLKQQTKKADP